VWGVLGVGCVVLGVGCVVWCVEVWGVGGGVWGVVIVYIRYIIHSTWYTTQYIVCTVRTCCVWGRPYSVCAACCVGVVCENACWRDVGGGFFTH
jgi:hypothetical protein